MTLLAATAHAATQRPYVNPNPYFMEAHPVLGTVIIIYIVIAGLIMFPTVRLPLMHWYRSQTWFVRGGDPIDVLFKQIGMRLSVEGFAFMVACLVGALGGWLYILFRPQPEAPAEAQVAD